MKMSMTNLGGFEKKSHLNMLLSVKIDLKIDLWASQWWKKNNQLHQQRVFKFGEKNIPWLIPWLSVLSSPSKWANKKKAGNSGKYHPLSSHYHPLLLMVQKSGQPVEFGTLSHFLKGFYVFYIPGAAGFLPSPVSSTVNGQISHYHPTIWPNMAKFHQT